LEYKKNKIEKLVHLVGFIIRIYHDAPSSECQMTPIGFPETSAANYQSTLLNTPEELRSQVKRFFLYPLYI